MLTYEIAKKKWIYDPDTGHLVMATNNCGTNRKGRIAGCIDKEGYVVIKYQKKQYFAHRVIWLIVHGEWPNNQIDHINGNRSDNRIENLRDVTSQQNAQNRRKSRRGSKSGLIGASFIPACGKWLAIIQHKGSIIRIGLFDTAIEAHLAYLSRKRELHPFSTI